MTDDWVCLLKCLPVGSSQVVFDMLHCNKVCEMDGILFFDFFMFSLLRWDCLPQCVAHAGNELS